MASLTPKSRSDEVTGQAMREGLVSGTIVLVPSLGALYFAMKNPKFRKLTNWQSRSALVIMPALFAFAFTSENKLIHRMEEVATETEHAMRSVEWAERKYRASPEEIKLHDLYRESVLNSRVRLVEGELGAYHKVANYVQANPFKIIAGIGIPSVAYIFWGQGHATEQLQMRLLHTRVFGQFAVICTLLGVMGLKEVMDHQGRYITEDEVEARVAEMQATRSRMLHKIEDLNEKIEHDLHKPVKAQHHT